MQSIDAVSTLDHKQPRMVSGIVKRLIEIEAGRVNSTEAQYFLKEEAQYSLYFSVALATILLLVFACCGARLT